MPPSPLRPLGVLAYTVFAVSTATAQDAGVDRAVATVTPEIIRIRQHLHQHPELSNREVETAGLVAEYLRKLGLEVKTGVAHTGVVAILRGGKPGPVVAIRADMDGLPVTEDTPLPFKSTVRTTYLGQDVGVAHACGHDIHTAVQLGVATILAGMRKDLSGTVKFIFQPAEEGPPPGEEGGAPMMIAEGVLDGPDAPEAIFGLHTWAAMAVGTTGWTSGPALASSDRFTLTIRGKQAHGASPHLSVDPIVVAAEVVQAFQTIRSRNLPPLAPSVITVGMVRGGTRFNIIPAEVELQGTVRTYSGSVQDTVEHRMREILDGITKAHRASYELSYLRLTPVTINDPALTAQMAPVLERVVGRGKAGPMEPWMAAEDFAYYARRIPGFFFRLGTLKDGTVSGDHHSPSFLADDSAIPVGMRLMSNVVLAYLKGDK